MKGQTLFVRAVVPEDSASLGQFCEGNSEALELRPGPALIGKLVGELVAHLSYTVLDDERIRLDWLLVAAPMRRKQVGRGMITELEAVARTLGARTIELRRQCQADEFFRKLGFVLRDDVLRKPVG